jgi:drug/metabolite transporter (DMT)-like permease
LERFRRVGYTALLVATRTRAQEAPISRKSKLVLALGLNQLLSSGTHIIGKGAVMAIGPFPVALLRFTIASTALLLSQRIRGPWPGIDRRDFSKILLLGFLVVPVNQGCFLVGLSRSSASHAALLYSLTPLAVLLLAGRILGEGAVRSKLVGTAVAFIGVSIIFLERGLAQEREVLTGDLLLLIAVFGWSLYTVLSKPLTMRYGAMSVTTWSMVVGTVLALPAFLLFGAIPPLSSIRPDVWGGILYLAVGTSMIAYPLWMYALRHLDASKVAITTNLQPILTAILSWIVFRERFTPGFLIGVVLVLAGVTWVETRRGSPAPEPTASDPAIAAHAKRGNS